MAGPGPAGPAERSDATTNASEPGDRGAGPAGTARLFQPGDDQPEKTEGTSGRDVEYEFAMSSLESMRIPGTSDYATVQTYKTLKRMGLASVDVQPETMKRAVSAMMAGDGTEVPLSMRTTTRPTGFSPPTTKGSTGKDRAEPPRAARERAEQAEKDAASAEKEAAARWERVRLRWRRARRLALASRPPPERAAALKHEEARDGAAGTIQRWWRGCKSRAAVRERIRAALFIRDRLSMWYHRRRRRDAAENIRAFLEDVGKGNEIVRRLHQLRRACATIQTAYRSAFRIMPDQIDSFVIHWTCYERYLHTSRSIAADRKKGKGEGPDFVRRRRACAPGFRMENVRSYDDVEARQLVPVDIKARLIGRFLKQRRRQRGKDWTSYKDALDAWRKNSLMETKLEMARSVMRGNEVRMDDLEKEIASKKPVMVRRRVLMNAEELARIHAEGEKEWRNETAFQDKAIQDLFRLSLKKKS